MLKKIGAKNMIGLGIYAFKNNIYYDNCLIEKFKDKIGIKEMYVYGN